MIESVILKIVQDLGPTGLLLVGLYQIVLKVIPKICLEIKEQSDLIRKTNEILTEIKWQNAQHHS